MNLTSIQADFDAIAKLSDVYPDSSDRYIQFLIECVPSGARDLLEVGCGLGELTKRLAWPGRQILALDLSPEMVARARQKNSGMSDVSFVCGDFLGRDFQDQQFDCVISSAALHHMDTDAAVKQMTQLITPGGRLILHDMRSDAKLSQRIGTNVALADEVLRCFLRTGRLRSPRPVRDAWKRHCANETYLNIDEVRALAERLLTNATIRYHWLWKYTIVWDKPHQR